MPVDLTVDALTRWLTDQGDQTVGVRGNSRCCPLANFMVSQGVVRPSVGPNTYAYSDGRTIVEGQNPFWMKVLVRSIDQLGNGRYITASTVLDLLPGVLRRAAEEEATDAWRRSLQS